MIDSLPAPAISPAASAGRQIRNWPELGLAYSFVDRATQIMEAFKSKFDLLVNEEIQFIRMSKFTVRETNRFDFAIVFENGPDTEGAARDLRRAVRSLTDHGIALDILYDNTVNEDSDRYTILLLRVSRSSLESMGRDLHIERWVAGGCSGGLEIQPDGHDNHPDTVGTMTYAEKIQIGELVVNAAGVRENHDHVKAIVPLFCDNFRRKFIRLYVQKLNLWRVFKKRSIQMWETIRQGDDNPDVRRAQERQNDLTVMPPLPEVQMPMSERRSLAEEDLGLIDNKFFIHEIRMHFGEKVALYFAFVDHYSRWLTIPVIVGVLVYLTQFIFSTSLYTQLLALFGCGVSAVWAPLMMKFWKRKNHEINLIWGTSNCSERDYPWISYDPEFRGCCRSKKRKSLQQNAIDIKIKRESDEYDMESGHDLGLISQLPLILLLLVFTISQIVLMATLTGFFVHVYIYLKTVPACDTPQANSSVICFNGFTRWLSIVAQGAALGLLVDVIQWEWLKATARWFTTQMNPRYEAQFEDAYTRRVFIFDWLNMYAWFWFLAFLYVPFGTEWSALVNEHFDLEVNIDPTKIELQDAFITPLIVTQALNFLIETFVPILIDRITNFKRMRRRNLPPTKEVQDMAIHLANELSQYAAPYRLRAYNSCGTEDNPQANFVDIIAVHSKSHYSIFSDMDDMCMQFGYVTMFSVVWPLIPICAFFNNIYEVRGDLMRLCYASRRPVQRKVANLGKWDLFFTIVTVISAVVNTALICLSTGHLEAFFPACQEAYERDKRFRPNAACFSWEQRLSIAALIEHILLIAQLCIFVKISSNTKWVQMRQKQMEEQTIVALEKITKSEPLAEDIRIHDTGN